MISYAHWELRLPSSAVEGSSALQRLGADRSFDRNDPAVEGVIAILAAQGCFLPVLPAELRLSDLFALLQPIRSELYAAYYAHPIWNRLRQGSASVGELTAWALHNYHISRSAGIIAARMAAQSMNSSLGEIFRDDTLEEYWHCDAFYFVKNGRLPIDPVKAKTYVPLPGIRAFEDVALRAAETDWLAHLLIAYFQESSVIFGDASENFYDEVEHQYDLPGFFQGWRRHLMLDRDHGHAEGLAALFDDERALSLNDVERSMRLLQLAHHFLLKALDQLSASPAEFDEAVELRQPNRIAETQQLSSAQFAPLPEAFWPFIRLKLEEASFAALAHVREHDDIMAAGMLAAMLRKAATATGASDLGNPWLTAVGNFLIEQARDLKLLLTLTDQLIGAWAEPPLSKGEIAKLGAARDTIGVPTPMALAVARYQLHELTELARSSRPLEPLLFGVRVCTTP